VKYKQNLRIEGNRVFSYDTHVATIVGKQLVRHGWWSVTTSKHINYVASVYGLTVVDGNFDETHESNDNPLRIAAVAAKMADVFCDNEADKNSWKLRMLKAGAGDGFNVPEDWDALTENEKKKRLNNVINVLLEK
jgi:hypothetical protein